MNKFLKNKTNLVITSSLLLFSFSWILKIIFNFEFFLYLSGFFLAIFVPGMALLNILEPEKNYLKKILIAPIFTVFFFMPIYYVATLLFDKSISIAIAFLLIIAISIFSIIFKNDTETELVEKNYFKFIFLGVITFILVHLLTTTVYKFIPEIDGYTYLANIEQNISSGTFNSIHRPLFILMMDYVSILSQIPPYWLFKFGMIVLQISGIYYLYEIIKLANIKNSLAKYLILLLFVSVPVINLEIDYIRPNIFFIFGLLPFIYYLSKGLDGQKKFFIYSSIISTVGLLFHEFFGILFIINAFFLVKYYHKKLSFFKKTIFISTFLLFFLILLFNIRKISSLLFIFNTIDDFIKLIINGIHWKWWFLGTYLNADGFNLGWTGLGILKYYAYFLSPTLAAIFLLYLIYLYKKSKVGGISSLEKIGISIFIVGFIFAEILPRIDFKTLPDRFWPMVSMALLSLAPFIFSEIKILNKRFVLEILLILTLIGTCGSIYVARLKGGYISEKEYVATKWIDKNTPKNAIFITQGGNGAMLDYFANRKNIVPFPSFFITDNIPEQQTGQRRSEKIYKNISTIFNDSLENPSDDRLNALNKNLKAYHEEIEKEKFTKNIEKQEFVIPKSDSIYVLYSMDKFSNYYAQRQWWKDVNFYGADLSKFKEGYDLVYRDEDIIYIWKRK